MTLRQTIAGISPRDEAAYQAALRHWERAGRPLGSMGLLEPFLARVAALTGSERIDLGKRTAVVLCADNGVVAEGVSQSGSGVTALTARQLASRRCPVCHMAAVAHCAVLPVDLGIVDQKPLPGLLGRRVRNGTGNILHQPAMTRAEAMQAIEIGMQLVALLKSYRTRVIVAGSMGVGSTTTASALACALLHRPAEKVTDQGTGLAQAGLARRIAVVQGAVAQGAPYHDTYDKLAKLGGLDIAGMVGLYLGGALYGVPVLVDGFASAVAALTAVRLCPAAEKAVFVAQAPAGPATALVLKALGQTPFLQAEMRLGEGAGAVAALPLLDMALALYNSAPF